MLLQLISFYILLGIGTFLGLVFLLRKIPERRWFVMVFLLAFLLRVFVILVFNVGLFDNQLEHPDSGFYMKQVGEIRSGKIPLFPLRPPHFLSALFFVFGDHVMVAEVLNAVLACFALLFISLCARDLFGARSGKICSVLLLLDPAFAYWTSQLLKEAVSVFLISAALYGFFRLYSNAQLVLFPAIFYLLHVINRGVFAFILSSAMLVISVIERRLLRSVIFVCIAFALLYAAVSPAFNNMDKIIAARETAASVQEVVSTQQEPAQSKVLHIVNGLKKNDVLSHRPFFYDTPLAAEFKTIGDLFSFLPYAVFYGFFAPFPWHAHSLFERLFSLSMAWWYALVPFVILGLLRTVRVLRAYVLSSFAIGVFLILSYGLVTIAPFVRWRLPAFIALYPFAAYGLDWLTKLLKSRGNR